MYNVCGFHDSQITSEGRREFENEEGNWDDTGRDLLEWGIGKPGGTHYKIN